MTRAVSIPARGGRAVALVLLAALAIAAGSCAVPKPGTGRRAAYRSNAIGIGLGVLLAGPNAYVLATDETGGGAGHGHPLIFGSALVAAGLIGVLATAVGKTCPADRSPWHCVE